MGLMKGRSGKYRNKNGHKWERNKINKREKLAIGAVTHYSEFRM